MNSRYRVLLMNMLACLAMLTLHSHVKAESMSSLKTVPVPEPDNLEEYIADRHAAEQLGKALFWDMQVGGDGAQSCASCHFHAGADIRRKNQLNPGLIAGDQTFQVGGPNYTLEPKDFPIKSNDVVSSQGISLREFFGVNPPDGEDMCNDLSDAVFHVGGLNTRRVEPRNAPTTVNAVFNFRNFWDGRATNDFNGVNPFGDRDKNAGVWRKDPETGQLEKVKASLEDSSLASQASGPPLSDFEMSCAARIFAEVGRKMLDPSVIPLRDQEVHPQDSLLGPLASRSGGSHGLTVGYMDLVRQAFHEKWWGASEYVTVDGQNYTQAEANFSLFFSLAVQLYEALLVADDTRVDRHLEGDSAALTEIERYGKELFEGKGKCINCHGGAELTNASVSHVSNERLERMEMGNGGCAIYDNGFYNIGVRPTEEDPGVGGTDPFGNPLSDTRMAMEGKFVDEHLNPALGEDPDCDHRAAVDGAFKTPGLRNVEITGPFFHNGGMGTLRQVVEFYNRGGDFASENIDNLDPDIQPLGLTQNEIDALVAFLQALTDERVRQEEAPFDHPQLFRPQGHPGDEHDVAPSEDSPYRAADAFFEVAAVGAGGRPAEGLIPLQPFLTVVKMTGGGRVGDGRDIANFDLKYRDHDGVDEVKFKLRDHASKQRIRSTSVDYAFTTETCVELKGDATLDKSEGYRYSLKACDNGQFHLKDDSDHPVRRDSFRIEVEDSAGNVVYRREGSLSGGNVQAHIS